MKERWKDCLIAVNLRAGYLPVQRNADTELLQTMIAKVEGGLEPMWRWTQGN